MAFKPIETEDDFNAAIKDRLERERGKFAGFDDYKDKAEKYDALIAENWQAKAEKAQKDYEALQTRYKDYDGNLAKEKARADEAEHSLLRIKVADRHKLPSTLADRITGQTEEEMDKDAEQLAALFKAGNGGFPRFTPEPRDDRSSQEAERDAAYRVLLNGLKDN